MKKKTLKRISNKLLITSIFIVAVFGQPHAAPLPNGTLLGIEQGVASVTGSSVPCASGSCFGMEVVPGLVIWTDFGPGTDGGIIVGKNQMASGQESSPSPANNASCEMTNAWNFFANYGCFYTPAGASENFFNNTSCAGSSCKGITQFGSLNVAWNGTSVPMGSTNGCNSTICSPDEVAGDFITNYTIGGDGQPWSIHYHNVVPNADPSSFGNVKFQFLARGVAVIPTPTPTPTPISTPMPTPPCDIWKSTGNVSVEGQTGESIPWIPKVDYISEFTCWISGQLTNGTATIASDCSIGSFIVDQPGVYTFNYDATLRPDSGCYIIVYSDPGIVTVTVTEPNSTPAPTPTPAPTSCEGLYPQTEITMLGKGKNLEVEETMTTTFKGHIVSTDEGKGKVTICRGSAVRYEVVSTVGTAKCTVKHGVSAESTGTLTDKGKLVCTNKPDGKDTDKFKIKRSKKKDVAVERRWFR